MIRKIWKKLAMGILAMAAMGSASAVYGAATPVLEYSHGTMAVGAEGGSTISMNPGETVELRVKPYVHMQYKGCQISGCPEKCGGYDCFEIGKGCKCNLKEGGDPGEIQTAEVQAKSKDETVVAVAQEVQAQGEASAVGDQAPGTLTLTAHKSGETQVIVTASMKDWNPAARTFTVKVGQGGDSPDTPSDIPPQDSTQNPSEKLSAPPSLKDTKAVMNGSGKVTFALNNYDAGWAQSISAVRVDQVKIEDKDYSVDENGLTVSTSVFAKGKRADYHITVESAGYENMDGDAAVHNYGAEKFYVRLLDKDGRVKSAKTYTLEEMIQMSGQGNAYYQTVCGMRGITSYKARGIYLEELLKQAGITFGPGMTLKLRTNDMAESKNDPENEDAYYSRGKFTYENLLGTPRYRFPDIYGGGELKERLLKADKFDAAMRTAVGGSRKEEVKPILAYAYTENVWLDDPDNDMAARPYDSSAAKERAFKFLFGIAMDEKNTGMISNTVTTWSAAYDVFGMDIVESMKLDDSQLGTGELKSAASADYQSIRLTWEKSDKADGYYLYRAAGKNKAYTQIQTVRGKNTLSYTDRGLATGKTYYYKVQAFSGTGASLLRGGISPAKSAAPALNKAVLGKTKRTSAKKASLQWKKTAGASGCLVYRSTSKKGTYRLVKTIKSGKKLTYTDTGLKKNRSYYYKIKAYRTVNGKRKTGAFSAAKQVKAGKR